MPSLASVMDRDALRREIFGATRERMLREMGEAIEALTEDSALVLVLEDLQWGDFSTLDLISFLARRSEPARLLLIGTYRPLDLLLSRHPLQSVKDGLELHGRCRELPLAFLSEAAVSMYLHARFPNCHFSLELASTLHRRTEGNPLFLINVVDHLIKQGLMAIADGQWRLLAPLDTVAVAVPETLRQMIDEQIDALPTDERLLLEAASAVGMEFPCAAVAAALGRDSLAVEEVCAGLARRRQFLKPRWPGRVA